MLNCIHMLPLGLADFAEDRPGLMGDDVQDSSYAVFPGKPLGAQ